MPLEKLMELKKTFQRNLSQESKIQASVLSGLVTYLKRATTANWDQTQSILKIQLRTKSLSKKMLLDQSGEIQLMLQRLPSTQWHLH